MSEQPLRVSLEAIDHRLGQFTLTFNSSQYSVTLNPETNVTFSEWLRRLHPVLVGQNDPSGDFPTGTLAQRGDVALAGTAPRECAGPGTRDLCASTPHGAYPTAAGASRRARRIALGTLVRSSALW